MSKETRVRALILGVVQGVGYRFFAVDEARLRGLSGWVKNRPDGSVEALVEGDPGLVGEYIERLRVGPPASRVTSVKVEREPYAGEFDSFQIRH